MESIIYFFIHVFSLIYYYKQNKLSFSYLFLLETGLFFLYDFLNVSFFVFYPCFLTFLYIFNKHISMISYFLISDLCFLSFPLKNLNYLFILIPFILISSIKKERELFYIACFLYVDSLILKYTSSFYYLSNTGIFVFLSLLLLGTIFIYLFTLKEKQYLEIHYKHENYQTMKEMDKHLRELHHDLKYQYLSMYPKIDLHQLDYDPVLYTTDSKINYQINQCVRQAREKGIDVKCMVSIYDFSIYNFDLGRILKLLFNKAIDSCLFEPHQQIILRLEQEEKGFYIKMEVYGKEIVFDNIVQLIQIYKGTCSFSYQDKNVFKAWIPRKEHL